MRVLARREVKELFDAAFKDFVNDVEVYIIESYAKGKGLKWGIYVLIHKELCF